MIKVPTRPKLPAIPEGLNENIAKELLAYTFIRGLCSNIGSYNWDNFPFYNQLKQTIKKETGKDYNPKMLAGKYYRENPLISLGNYVHPNHPGESQSLPAIIPNYQKYMTWVFECIVMVNKYWLEQTDYRNAIEEQTKLNKEI